MAKFYPGKPREVPAMKPGHVEILVGPAAAPEKILTAEVSGQNIVQVGFPPRGLMLTYYETGLAVQAAGGMYKTLTWDQLAAFAETGELSTRAYGLVCDGTFRAWYPSRAQAEHMAADLRATYGAVSVVEVAPELAARLAK